MAVHVVGLIVVIVFYVAILAVGAWAAWRSKMVSLSPASEDFILAGRNLGVLLSAVSMTATLSGGQYVMSIAEYVSSSGLMWAQAPLGYALSLILGGVFFARKMREEGYVTMLDPFERKYGKCMATLLCLPALLGELFTVAVGLAGVGSMLAVTIEADPTLMTLLTACVAVLYTMVGGMYAVVYTHVVQLSCLFLALCLAAGFAAHHPAVDSLSDTEAGQWHEWLEALGPRNLPMWIDFYLVLILGGIPWQSYFQRVLSSRSPAGALGMSVLAAVGCLLVAAPTVFLGVIAKATDWNQTDYAGSIPIAYGERKLILPMVMHYLCPAWVTFVGLGAVSAAVMSSADSSVLGAASMFARNIYKGVFRQRASEREIVWVMRVAILGVGILAMIMGITIHTIYGLWLLCADLVYVILFPQLVSVVYLKGTNTYGSLSGYSVGMLFRFLGGEGRLIELPALIKYPMYNHHYNMQLFPFRTLTMLMSFSCIVAVSYLVKWLFESGKLPKHRDVFRCVVNLPDEAIPLPDDPPKHSEVPLEVQANREKKSSL